MGGVVEDHHLDAVVHPRGPLIAGRLHREEVQHRRLGHEPAGAAIAVDDVGDHPPGRDHRLVGLGRYGDVGGDPVGADVVAAAGGFVLQLRGTQLGRQSRLAPLGAVGQQALAVHADHRRELHVVHEGAVVDQAGGVAAGLEAALFQYRLEGHGATLAGLHRGGEAVDPVVEILPFASNGRALDGQADHLQIADPAQVYLGQGRAGVVDQHIGPARRQLRLMRAQVHDEADIGHRRLGRGLVAQQGLLIGGLFGLPLGLGLVFVPDIGVHVDEDAEADEGRQGRPADQARGPHQPVRQPLEARP